MSVLKLMLNHGNFSFKSQTDISISNDLFKLNLMYFDKREKPAEARYFLPSDFQFEQTEERIRAALGTREKEARAGVQAAALRSPALEILNQRITGPFCEAKVL